MVFTEEPAPIVTVPADFGIEHLQNPSHCNLTFNVKEEGETILANSVIISLNSPVVESITTTVLESSVAVLDFKKDAVQCFVEGCYTGRLEKMNKENFREVNTISHTLKISWMQGRCADYFQYLIDEIPEEDYQYDDLLYLFEEAFYVHTTVKNKMYDFINNVNNKFSSISGCNKFFISRYVMENQLDEKLTDVLVKFAGSETEILVKCIINQVAVNKSVMSDNCRYLLEKVNLHRYIKKNPDVQNELIEAFNSIKNPSPEDYKLVLSLYKTSSDGKYDTFPNLFHSFKCISKFATFEDLFNYLSSSPDLFNLYMFIEGIYCWFFNGGDHNDGQFPEDLADRVAMVSHYRGWDKVCASFIEGLCPEAPEQCTTLLIEEIKKSEDITAPDCGRYIESTFECTWEDLFLKEHDIEFIFDKTDEYEVLREPCSQPGTCGFILHVTPCTDKDTSLFDIQLLDDPAAYPSHIHFHDDLVSSNNMHIVLRGSQWTFPLCPLSWYGKPDCNAGRTMWRWGANCFIDSEESIVGFKERGMSRAWNLGRQAKITLAVFITKIC